MRTRPATLVHRQGVRRLDDAADVQRLLDRLETVLPLTPAAKAHRLLADAVRRLCADRPPALESAFAAITTLVKETNARCASAALTSIDPGVDDLIEELHQDILCGNLSSTPAPPEAVWTPTWHPRQLERAHPRYARKLARA